MKPRLILDLDGTVLDDSDRHWRVFIDVTRLSIEKQDYWNLRRNGLSNADVLRTREPGRVFDLDLFKLLIESKDYLALDRLIPRPQTLLWISKEFEVILCTIRSHEDNLMWQLGNFGLLNYINRVIVVTHLEFGSQKTKANSLRIHLDGAFEPRDLVVGDTEIDVRTGKELGIRTYAVESGIRCYDFLQKFGPDFILSDLNDLLSINEDPISVI